MKYFVTGGMGFIGSILVQKLLDANHQVTVYDNLSSGKLQRIPFKNNKNFKFIRGDILNKKKLDISMKNSSFVFHLAANPDVRKGERYYDLDFNVNSKGTLNVLKSMKKNKIKNLCFISTSTIYGIASQIPTKEDYGPLLPISLYGASKLASEAFISAYSEMFDIKSWIFRLANITGPTTTHGIVFDFAKKLQKNKKTLQVLGNGKQKKSYLTVEMVCDAMIFVIKKTQKQKLKIHLYNLGNSDSVSVKTIATTFIKNKNLSSKIIYLGGVGGWKGDVPRMELSINKLKKLGWKPKLTSKQCIEYTIDGIDL